MMIPKCFEGWTAEQFLALAAIEQQKGERNNDSLSYTNAAGWRQLAAAVARPAEDLTPEGIQLVIPGAERQQPAGKKQMELF